jgi:outer membrane lipoprotein-sorting protein
MTPRILSRICACVLILICLLISAAAQEHASASVQPTVKQIVEQMKVRNRKRAEALKGYTGTRYYRLVYTGFPGDRVAEIVVDARFEAPNKKEFTVISQSGSAFIIKRVLKRLLESEQEANTEEQRARTAMTEQNYDFELLGQEVVGNRPAYVLRVIPKVDSKFLYRGKAWVDTQDFAIVKIEAEPAKRPSIWISRTQIHHVYAKIGDFWLPAENQSTTDVRLGGVAVLTIRYTNYKVSQNHAMSSRLPQDGNSPLSR